MIALIAAVARNRVIGKGNRLLCHLPEDLRRFREITRGKPVLMGRKTWESLPEKFRPLPGRHNLVLSRDPSYVAPGATLAGSLAEAIEIAGDADEIFVIGGAELYRQALPLAGRLYLTELSADFDGDAFFPELTPGEWMETSRQQPAQASLPAFSFVVYQRR